MNKSIKLISRYACPRSASGALALGAALLVAPLGFAQDAEDEDVYELSPFTVEGETNSGYRATSTLAGTRIRTDLKDVGSAISVVTEEFLRDTGATDNESLLVYTPSTEVAGVGGNFAGGGDGGRVDSDSQRLRPNASTRVRGLAAADNTRNFFVTDIPWDSYNVNRIDIQRGPNSILFGLGSPAGVIEATTNSANYEDGGRAEIRIDEYDSLRLSVDYNKVILEDELAVRVSALNDSQNFKQDGAFEDDERYFFALKYQPKGLQTESSNTTFEASYESGDIEANRPRIIPPIDRITPWFDEMGKAGYDAITLQDTALTVGSGSYSPWITPALGRIFDGPVAVFDNVNHQTQSYYFMPSGTLTTGAYQGVTSYDAYAKRANDGAGLPASGIGVYKTTTIEDPTIFDFYGKLIDGPNKSEWQKWDAYNVSISHNMFDNKLGFKVDLDKQDYEDGQTNVLDNAGQSITVDIMQTLPNGTDVGQPNPNFGRPFIGGDAQNNNQHFRERENFRVTAYYSHDFKESGNEQLGNILGQHNFTAVFSDSKYTQRSASWIRAASENINSGSSITQANRYIANLVYIGPSLLNASSASGANLNALQTELIPTDGEFDLNDGNTPVRVWSVPGGDIDNLYRNGNLARNKTESKAVVWQGKMFDGVVVPMFGYREDTDVATNAGNVPAHPSISGARLPFDSSWQLPSSPSDADPANNKTYTTASGINRTEGLVIHSPQAVKDALGGWNVSLTYSDSENFRPDASRRDLIGDPIAPTTGETTEKGIVISSPDDRFIFKVNKFDTKVYQDTLSGSSIGNSYMIGAGEGWAYLFGHMAQAGIEDFRFNYALVDPEDPDSARIDPNIGDLRYQPKEGQSIADALAEQEAALSALFNTANNLDDPKFQQFLNFWNQDWDAVAATPGWAGGGAAWAGEPGQFAVTGDTVSEGYEYELFFQPTDNWNITVNASKTEAKRLNIADSYASFVEDRKVLYDTAYGDVRLWGPSNSTETLRGKWNSEFFSNYTLFRLLNNSNVAELRPWRWNVVSNYQFRDGKLAGLNIGGAWRWQDEVVVGYPVLADNSNQYGYTFDVANPYKGGSESNIDLWAGYTKELNDNVTWRIQVNVRNAFEDERLIGITTQPNGDAATSRIAEGQVWSISNSFMF
ncbi:TonB-dependent receptor [Pelagicoccus sp. NFK12]|uniref:TonB-dependent receptor n=1 Tax=Pelagicoccus enzymogenes TaxID=2773457 RepID=A0A927IJJ1_9BACT|nr:TonB-dependent receptor plug domain-containing protein [Pelagicoccus enzymogenes]MBD5781858.1 TonB-dependent receptor [Pelagicoccus enzymogenes]